MTNLSYIFIGIVSILLGLSALLFYRLFTKEEEFEKAQEKIFANYSRILKQARARAREILGKATDQSIQLYRDAHVTNEHILEELDQIIQSSLAKHLKNFDSVSETFITNYTNSLSSMEKSFNESSQNSLQLIQTKSTEVFSHLSETLGKEFENMPASIEKKLEESLTEVNAQIQTYKQMQTKRIDESVKSVFLDTYKEILGNSINLQLHNELILKALEKARIEGVFSEWKR